MHKHKRKKKIWRIVILISGIFVIIIAGSLLSLYLYSNRNAVRYDEPEKMVATAHKLYQKGRLTEAVEQLAYYCQYYAQDDAADLFLELGQWYTEAGNEEKAAYIFNQALSRSCPDLKQTTVIDTNHTPFRFRMEPLIGFTRNVHLLINAESLISPKQSVHGKISTSGNLIESEDYRTSNWFWVSHNMHNLLLTGNFNCAIWEFQNGSGISTIIETGEIGLSAKSYVTVTIPSDAVKCRVTYRQPENGEYTEAEASVYCADQLNDFGGNYFSLISLPDLQENQFVLYGDGIWSLWKNNQFQAELELPALSCEDIQNITVLSDVCGNISVTFEPESTVKNDIPVGIKILDAPYSDREEKISAIHVKNETAEGQILLSSAAIAETAVVQASSGTAEANIPCRLYTAESNKMVLQFCGYTNGAAAKLTVGCGDIENTVFLNSIPTDFYIPITNVELIRKLSFAASSEEKCSVTIEGAALVQYDDTCEVQELALGAFQRIDYAHSFMNTQSLTQESSSQCLVSADDRYLFSISESNGTFNVYRLGNNGSSKKVSSLDHLGGVRDMAFTPDKQAILISSRFSGMWIVDVSRPEKPEILSHYTTLEYACGICVSGTYAFVANRDFGVEIIDISDLRNPQYIRTVVSETVSEYFDCFVDGNYLYIGIYLNQRIDIYDISDVRQPVLCAEIPIDGVAEGCVVRDGILYVAAGYDSRNKAQSVWDYGTGTGGGLEIYDVHQPKNPKLLSVTKVPGRNNLRNFDVWDVQLTGHYAVLSDAYNGILVYDVANSRAPKCVNRLEYRITPEQNIYSQWNPSVNVYPWDTAVEDRGTVFHTFLNNGNAYAVVRQVGVVLVDLGIDMKAQKVPSVFPFTRSEQTEVFSLRNYTVTASDTQAYIWAVAEKGGLLYAAAGDDGILVFDTELNLIHQEKTGTTVRDIKIHDSTLFTAEGTDGVGAYLMDGSSLTLLSRLSLNRGFYCTSDIAVTADGIYLIAQVSQNYYITIDCFDPAHMSIVNDRVSDAGLLYYRTTCSGTVAGTYVGIAGSSYSCWYESQNGKLAEVSRLELKPSRYANGMTAVGKYALAITNAGYRYSTIDHPAFSELIIIKGISLVGKPASNGEKLVLSSTAEGEVIILNIHSIKQPILEARFHVNGNPDVACFVGSSIYLPCHHGGLLKITKQ